MLILTQGGGFATAVAPSKGFRGPDDGYSRNWNTPRLSSPIGSKSQGSWNGEVPAPRLASVRSIRLRGEVTGDVEQQVGGIGQESANPAGGAWYYYHIRGKSPIRCV